jgi:hypothetical protein
MPNSNSVYLNLKVIKHVTTNRPYFELIVILKFTALKGFEHESQLQSIINDEDNQRFIIVNFEMDKNTTQLPKKIEYTIRVRHNGLETHEIYLKSVRDSYSDSSYYKYTNFPYRDSGFLSVKLALDISIVEMLSNRQTEFDVRLAAVA